jgi:hypothetical protein
MPPELPLPGGWRHRVEPTVSARLTPPGQVCHPGFGDHKLLTIRQIARRERNVRIAGPEHPGDPHQILKSLPTQWFSPYNPYSASPSPI